MIEEDYDEYYLYESHMGGLSLTDCDMEYNDLYCEQCGDSDMVWKLGNREETLKYLLGELMTATINEIDWGNS